nr:TRAP transporter substrate-binding protein DctP [Succinivibrionaceae bacterium]
LGTKQELLSLIEQGSNVVTNVEYELLSERGAGELGLISVPYAFRNWDEVRAFEQGEGFKQALLWLERERNLKVLCSWHYAPRHFFARRPVHNLSDLQNRTILTRSSALHSTFFEAFGAIPASLRFSENDLLEQGLDAIDNTVVGFHDNFFVKFRNKRWHAYLDSHNFATFAVVTSARAFNALPKASRDLLYGTCNQVGERIESSMPAREERLRQEMVAAGLGVSAPDPNASHLEEAFREQFLASPVTLGHFSYSRYLELMDQLQGSR